VLGAPYRDAGTKSDVGGIVIFFGTSSGLSGVGDRSLPGKEFFSRSVRNLNVGFSLAGRRP
jgi:hypothetical protein